MTSIQYPWELCSYWTNLKHVSYVQWLYIVESKGVVVGVAVEFASRHLRNQKPDLWSMQEVSGGPTPDTYGVSFDL